MDLTGLVADVERLSRSLGEPFDCVQINSESPDLSLARIESYKSQIAQKELEKVATLEVGVTVVANTIY